MMHGTPNGVAYEVQVKANVHTHALRNISFSWQIRGYGVDENQQCKKKYTQTVATETNGINKKEMLEWQHVKDISCFYRHVVGKFTSEDDLV